MNNILLRMAKGAVFGALCALSLPSLAQDTDLPLIMTLNTNIYGYQGPTNSFTIYLGSTEEDVEVYVESPTSQEFISIDPWTLGKDEEGSNAAIATPISLSVTEKDNEIRIYGDKSKIDYIDLHGTYLSSVKLNGYLPNLTVIDLSHNELTEIDLSDQTNLASIDLLDNAFKDPAKMIIGTNHPDLMILSVGINDVIDPALNLTNFPNLQYFSARNNYGVYAVDPTQCPKLVSLVLEVTNVSSIDVSKNPNLDVLNLSQTRVTSVDLSNNPNLGEFYINHEGSFNNSDIYRVKSIDLSKNPLIEYLDLGGNALTSIDLSKNTKVRMLYLQRNLLSQIDLSNLTQLSTVNLSNNLFTFATLPIPKEGWDYYYYRSPLTCDFKYKVNQPIDFSASVLRAPYAVNGTTVTPVTYANVFKSQRAGSVEELDPSLYNYDIDKAVLTFKEAIPDSVFVEFYCDIFPEWPLSTTQFMVKTEAEFDAPSAAFSFTPSSSMAGKSISMSLGASRLASYMEYPADVTIIANGESQVLKGVVTGSSMPDATNITFNLPASSGPVTVALPDGYAISALGIDGISLSSIDLSPAEGLNDLRITNCGLSSINMAYNRALKNLDLSNNQLRTVDLAGIRGDYQKFNLATINISNNKLIELATVSAATIFNLNLSNNNFTNFDLKYYTGLRNLDLSYNKLSGELDFSTVEKLQGVNVCGNYLNSIVFNTTEGALENLTQLNLSDNNFSFATLPIFANSKLNYFYAPQKNLEILANAPTINLSAQNIIFNGEGTNFVWKYADNAETVPVTLLSNAGGATVFDDSLVGKTLYCEMTNNGFPQFNGNPLKTSNVTVASRPTNLVATLTTVSSGETQIGFRFNKNGTNAVYIDWKGDGSEYTPYIYEAGVSYPSIYRIANTYAGATAKIYTYDSPEDIAVFALWGAQLENADLSPMTKVEAIDMHNTGLYDGKLILPESKNLWELVLDGNNFETQTFENLTELANFNLAGNKYTSFDLSLYPKVRFMQLSHNKISNIKFGNNSSMYQLDLTGNNLSNIDLNGAKGIEELLISDNQISEIDITPIKDYLRVLYISGNRFTFASLPDVSICPYFTTFDYTNQRPMDVACYEYKIDLSSQAVINGTPTDYYWFLGDFQSDVYYDYYYESFVGEQLEGPEDSSDPEYTIENGVTTFLYPESITRNVICAMTNSQYPNLILYTSPTRLSGAGIESLFDTDSDGLVNVYNLSGVLLKHKVSVTNALKGLEPGIYLINSKKIMVTRQ